MENLESKETNILEKKSKGIFNQASISPKLITILLIVNLVIGIFSLAGIGYLTVKNHDRGQMVNFRSGGNGGMMSPPNGGGGTFNQ